MIDVEGQNTNPGSSHLAGRFFYCIGVLLTSQKNDVSGCSGDEYRNVKPILALWIMSHMEHSFIIHCRSRTEMIFTDSDTGNAGQNLCHALDGFIRIKVAAVGNDRDESGDGAIQCLSHIFRGSIDPEKQI